MRRDAASILGLETSCDETAAAVVDRGGCRPLDVVASQAELHARYGGVVPEIASRRHLELVSPVVRTALDDAGVDARRRRTDRRHAGPRASSVRCSSGSPPRRRSPGRAGLPLAPVDHLRAHVATLYLAPDPLEPPFTCLLASGGHTMLLAVRDRAGFEVLGSTLDDAAGEAFDKGARLLGLGYPGGAELDRLAREGDPEAFSLPGRPRARARLLVLGSQDRAAVRRARPDGRRARSGAAPTSRRRTSARSSGRSSAVSPPAAEQTGDRAVAVVGGVAANSELRAALPDARFAPLALCTDNAAMVASAARFVRPLAVPDYLALDAYASSERACGVASLAIALALAAGGGAGAARRAGRRGGLAGTARVAARCRSSAAGGSSSSSASRSPTASAGAGGRATELQMRSWTAAAQDAQRRAIAKLVVTRRAGRPRARPTCACSTASPRRSTRRCCRLSSAIRPSPGVYPVRAAYPAAVPPSALDSEAFGPASGRRVGIELPGVDGTGITVALLDTGVDLRHPFLQGPAPARHRRARTPTATRRPSRTRPSRGVPNATAPSSPGSSSARAARPACTASLRARRSCPIRVAGWQPDADGGVSVYGRTDQLLAGLEAAVDPNGDGDAHDAARIALVGVVEPFSSFPDGPLARAGRGALALDTLVVAPAGNDGPAGPGYGSVAAPRPAHPASSAVAASDSRGRSPTVHVLLRAGLRVLASGETPLGGAVGPPERRQRRRSSRCRAEQVVAVTRGNALDPLFDDDRAQPGRRQRPSSSRPGRRRPRRCASCRRREHARCSSTGRSPPVRSVSTSRSRCRSSGSPHGPPPRCAPTSQPGSPSSSGVGAAAFGENPELGAVASFSSTGLALDGSAGAGVAAPGVGLVTSAPGRNEGGSARYGTISGSSAAAAVVAGAAALLAQARPDLDAVGLARSPRRVGAPCRRRGGRRDRRPRGRLVGRARRRPAARRLRCAHRSEQGKLRPRHAAERLASRSRRRPPPRRGRRRRDGGRGPDPRRAPARSIEGRPADLDRRGAPGGTRRSERRDPRRRRAGRAPPDPVERGRPRHEGAADHARRALPLELHPERSPAGRPDPRRRPRRRRRRPAAAPPALDALDRALPRRAARRHARPAPRRAARAATGSGSPGEARAVRGSAQGGTSCASSGRPSAVGPGRPSRRPSGSGSRC